MKTVSAFGCTDRLGTPASGMMKQVFGELGGDVIAYALVRLDLRKKICSNGIEAALVGGPNHICPVVRMNPVPSVPGICTLIFDADL